MKTSGVFKSTFNQTIQKLKSKIQPPKDLVKKIPDYVAVDMNGLVAYVPADKIPKGAKVLTKTLTSGAEVLAEMNKGLVNKVSK